MEFAVRLVHSGTRKIQVIKAIRQWTGMSLRQAKDTTDYCGVVADHLAHNRAEALARALRALGAAVEVKPILDVDEAVVAYDPSQDVRQRLVEVFRSGASVAIRRRAIGGFSQALAVIDLSSVDAARARMAAEVGDRTCVATELQAYTALTARNADLERAIVEALDEDAPRLVYADWLIEQGDVCGERLLQAVQGQQASDHRLLLLGPAADVVTDDDWDRGLLTQAALRLLGDGSHRELSVLFGFVGALGLRSLDVTMDVARVLCAGVPPALDDLVIRSGGSPQPGDADVVAALGARVRGLAVAGIRDVAFTLRSPRLEYLSVDSYGDGSDALQDFLAGAHLPNLTEMRIDFESLHASGRPAFFDLEAPRLRQLSLAGLVDLRGLARAPVLASVERLQLALVDHLHADLVAARPLFGDRRVELEGWPDDFETRDSEGLRAAGYVLKPFGEDEIEGMA